MVQGHILYCLLIILLILPLSENSPSMSNICLPLQTTSAFNPFAPVTARGVKCFVMVLTLFYLLR